MSAAELQPHALDIVELAALRGRAREMRDLAARHQTALPDMGRATEAGEQITLCVRPERWLILSALAESPQSPGGLGRAARRLRASEWHQCCESIGVAVDLSSALTAFRLTDPALLAPHCRLDLDPQVFPVGHAAATILAQVSVILANLANGMLLLTPSTTARHFREWLGEHVR